ncbi:MAG: hypothetical protein KJ621_16920 [Proteobacteria bacterium]|nr:hypothetical protein [Pseudomonadota bacterium]
MGFKRVFKVETDGLKISFMSPSKRGLLVGMANDKGIVVALNELTAHTNGDDLDFSGGEVWRRKATTPLFERIAFQFIEIVESVLNYIPRKTIDLFKAELLEIAFDFSKAEEAILEYIQVESEAISRCQSEQGVIVQPRGIRYENPTMKLKAIAEKILMQLVIGMRKLPVALSLITGTKFSTGEQFIAQLKEFLPAEHPDRASIDSDQEWIKELYDIRGTIEHGYFDVDPFEVVSSSDTRYEYEIKTCRIALNESKEKNANLGKYLEVTLHNCFTFCEESLALVLESMLKYPVVMATLPEELRSQRKHYRFVLDLVPEVKKQITGD